MLAAREEQGENLLVRPIERANQTQCAPGRIGEKSQIGFAIRKGAYLHRAHLAVEPLREPTGHGFIAGHRDQKRRRHGARITITSRTASA